MRRVVVLAALLFTVALAWSGPAVADPPGDNDTRECVTRKEYQLIEQGDTKKFVHRTFDFRGRRVSRDVIGEDVYEVRQYRVCGTWRDEPGAHVRVTYKNGKVFGKQRSWD